MVGNLLVLEASYVMKLTNTLVDYNLLGVYLEDLVELAGGGSVINRDDPLRFETISTIVLISICTPKQIQLVYTHIYFVLIRVLLYHPSPPPLSHPLLCSLNEEDISSTFAPMRADSADSDSDCACNLCPL